MNWWVCNVMCTYLLVLHANVYGINKTVIVASRWFLYYLTYIDDARSNTNQVYCCSGLPSHSSLLIFKITL